MGKKSYISIFSNSNESHLLELSEELSDFPGGSISYGGNDRLFNIPDQTAVKKYIKNLQYLTAQDKHAVLDTLQFILRSANDVPRSRRGRYVQVLVESLEHLLSEKPPLLHPKTSA